MTKAELEKYLAANIGKPKMMALSRQLAGDGDDLKDLIDLTFHLDEVVGFRAAWVAETIFIDEDYVFLPYLSYFFSRIKEVTNPGCKRHYAKIAMHMTGRRATKEVKEAVAALDLEPVVEQCFDWMIDAKVKVAVKVFAAEALFNMRLRYPWIADELREQLGFLMRDGSMAIKTRGKKLLQALEKR